MISRLLSLGESLCTTVFNTFGVEILGSLITSAILSGMEISLVLEVILSKVDVELLIVESSLLVLIDNEDGLDVSALRLTGNGSVRE